jgi:hypothetical protein
MFMFYSLVSQVNVSRSCQRSIDVQLFDAPQITYVLAAAAKLPHTIISSHKFSCCIVTIRNRDALYPNLIIHIYHLLFEDITRAFVAQPATAAECVNVDAVAWHHKSIGGYFSPALPDFSNLDWDGRHAAFVFDEAHLLAVVDHVSYLSMMWEKLDPAV